MPNEAPVESMPVVSRFFFAITCLIMIIFDGVFAADVDRTRRLLPPRKMSPKAEPALAAKAQVGAESAKVTTVDSATSDALEGDTAGVDHTLKDRSPPKPKSVPPLAASSDNAQAAQTAVTETLAASTLDAAETDKFAARERGALLLLSLLQREGRFVDFLQQEVSSFDDAQVGAAARVVHDGCRRALKSHLTIEPIAPEAEGDNTTLELGYDVHAIKLVGNVSGKPPYKGSVQHRGWRAMSLVLPKEVGAHDASVLAQAEIEL